MHKLFLGTLLNPKSPQEMELIHDGAILVDDAGVIVTVGPREGMNLPVTYAAFDYSDLLIMPGFIDTHCHVAQVRAVNIRYSELLVWLNTVVFPLESGYSGDVAAGEAPRFFSHLLSTGTTTAGLYVTVSEEATDRVFQVAERMGIRAVIGKVMMDRHSPPELQEQTAVSIDASIRLCEKWHGRENNRLRYAFTPRFALTCSAELMKAAGDAAHQYDCHVMTHVAENRAEVKRAAELFPQARSYLDVYREAGLLKRGAILAHAIYLDEQDWDVIAKSGAGVAHCPISNLLLESGILDLSAPLSRGIPVGFGSDIGAGSEPAIVEVAESAIGGQISRKVLGHSHRLVTPELAFYQMTKGGAEAMGLGDVTGDLSPGKAADLVVLDPRECLPLHEWREGLTSAQLLYGILLRFRAAAIKTTFVQGRQVYMYGDQN